MTSLRILCWEHRRAVDPMRAAIAAYGAENPDVAIELSFRPLSDFEHQGIAGAAAENDMVVFDHPFCGDIAESEVFLPLEDVLAGALGEDSRYVGPSLATYRYGGHIWGAPIDAATQHAVTRPDLLDAAGEPMPESWGDAVALGERLVRRGLKLGMAVETPHAILTIGSLMANAGAPWGTDPNAPMTVDRGGFLAAMEWMRELLAFCPPESLAWNSIDLHAAMVARDDVAYCPCVYGYATYGESDMRRPLGFGPFAGAAAPYAAGSAIGGTALAVSRSGSAPEAALDFAAFMLGRDVQCRLIPECHGQAATNESWDDPANDARFNGFFSAARSSMETAWVRPRLPGYTAFQHAAGEVVAAALRGEMPEAQAVDHVRSLAERVGAGSFA